MPKALKYTRSKCIGCNLCVDMAPHLWEMNNSDAKADLLNAQQKGVFYTKQVFDDEQADMINIARACPGKAIIIT